ncbi:protein bicaudal C homolog 1-B-like [Montipora capricornis]|uniref:protein bicaudal C homolog 1-B-like n=1 Tax=Montipora capricornis TaxID=246305 RepID=UPI0035F1261F
MKMATGLEFCEDEGDLLADEINEESDPNLVEERFRVDRRKLEQMLQAAMEGCGQTGEEFFQKIMEETATTITWPSKLKIGAKSKKDPHIKVAGLPESVRQAKEKVMAVLDTKSSRVTLNMHVSHTDHSHILGKGGGNIKQVMQDTGCHIHFPDSNRGATNEKSNQVSIAGQPLGVESARQQIRDLLPLVLTFELPLGGRIPSDASSPAIQQICQLCNVTITFKQRPRSGSQTAIIRGSQQHVGGIKDAISHLVEHFTAKIASSVPVNMQIDIAPQHHLFIIGRSGINIKQIMQRTGASITFPDPNGTQRKGTVFITGPVESVISARAQLIDCLPLVLMFDLREEDEDADNAKLTKIMEAYDVFVSVKPKPKQPSKSVIVKSAEKNVQNMYLARLEILGLDSNENLASSPTFAASGLVNHDHRIPSPDNNFTTEYFSMHTGPVSTAVCNSHPWFTSPISPTSPTISNMMCGFPTSAIHPFVDCSTSYSTNPPPPPGLGPPTVTLASLASNVSSGYLINHSMPASNGYINGTSSGLVQNHLGKSGGHFSQRTGSPLGHRTPSPIGSGSSIDRQSLNGSPRRSSSGSLSPMSPTCTSPLTVEEDSNLHSMSSGNDLTDSIPYHDVQSHGSNGVGQNPVGSSGSHGSKRQSVQILSGAKNVNLQTSTSSLSSDTDQLDDSLNSSLALLQKILPNAPTQPVDKYDYMKSMATVAMQKKVVINEVRRPTNTWSGLGFSKSMPESVIKELLDFKAHKKGNLMPYNGSINGGFEPSNPSSLFTSGPRDTRRECGFESSLRTERFEEEETSSEGSIAGTIGSRRNSCSSAALCPDLRQLFEKVGLAKYFSIFQEQEVDLPTFLTLTDKDLKELGISTFGIRKKILLMIQDLKKNPNVEATQSGPVCSARTSPPQVLFSDTNTFNPLPFYRRHPYGIASKSGRW